MVNKLKKAQVTAFIIVVLVLIGGIIIYLEFGHNTEIKKVPTNFKPVYSYYLSCIENNVLNGVKIIESQGGYIKPPEFSPGSEYMPFSSQLDFMGIGVPYWYYISGNGIVKEQVPSKEKMESQLNDYVENELNYCDFSYFKEKGFQVDFSEAKVKTKIYNDNIKINVKQEISIKFGNDSFYKKEHNTRVSSSLGKFYDFAKRIYEKQKDSMFLEKYGVDILRLYAPVDGNEISCSPKIWSLRDIREDLIEALEGNIPALKIKGSNYVLKNPKHKYFVVDVGKKADMDVDFVYLRQWPMKLEVWPSDNGILKADPVGLQEHLGMLGFCYVPYHFVYDFAYPVLIQLYDGNERFQFPVVVYIEKNNPRKALDVEGLPDVVPELCEHKLHKINIQTYDTELNPVKAKIRFKCFDTTCDIGYTNIRGSEAVLDDKIPQCVNGYLLASAKGYETKKYLVSSLEEKEAFIVLNKKYKINLEIQRGGSDLDSEFAVVNFIGEGKSISIPYPQQKEVELTEGQYKIVVYIYSNSTITLKGSSVEKCIDVPRSGVGGLFGMTKKKCFEMNIPDQVTSAGVSGGGTQEYYITESELKNSKKIIINADSFGIPSKVEQLQENYNKIKINGLDIEFK